MKTLAVIASAFVLLAAQESPGAPFAYISGFSKVAVFDTASREIVTTIEVGGGATGIALNPAGTRAYVGSRTNSSVSVIDTATNLVMAAIAVVAPGEVAVSPSGKRVYVSNQPGAWAAPGTLSVIDAETNRVIATVPVGLGSAGLAVTPDGSRVYVANSGERSISVIDAATNRVVSSIATQSAPYAIAIDRAGARIYATLTGHEDDGDGFVLAIDASSHAILKTLKVDYGPVALSLHPTAARAYVSNWGNSSSNGKTVSVIDTNELAVIGTILVGWNPNGISVHPSGKFAYVTNSDSHTLSVIDTATNAVTSTIKVGFGPSGISAVGTGGNYQGLWWNPSESGWGVNLAHEGDALFATWFTYDAAGKGQWLSMSNGVRTGSGGFSGTLYRTTGPAFDMLPWNPASVTRTAVGTATFTFTDPDNGTFAYQLDGVSQSRSITRLSFGAPATICR